MTKTIQKNSIIQQIISQIIKYISENELDVGDKLPTERDLSKIWGVSRSSIHSAIQLLSYNNLLFVRQGSGIYVKELPDFYIKKNIPEPIEKIKMFEGKLEARMILECESVRLAAIRRDNQDLQELDKILSDMRDSLENKDLHRYSILDLNFHSTLIHSTKNELLFKMAQVLWEDLPEWFLGFGKIENLETESFSQHEAILSAIHEKNPELAAKSMQEHICYAIDANKILQQE